MVVCGALLLSLTLNGSPVRAGSDLNDPKAISAQIEADWLRQELLRPSTSLVGKQVAPEADARGGCDGIKNGYWGFHVYQGLDAIPRGSIKSLRVVAYRPRSSAQTRPNLASPAKTLVSMCWVRCRSSPTAQPTFAYPAVSGCFPGARRTGVGRADHVHLDLRRAGQTQACIGCHESREAATLPGRKFPSAASQTHRGWRLDRKEPGRCATTTWCSRCSTSIARVATGQMAKMPTRPGSISPR